MTDALLIPPERLGSGTPTGGTVLHGDQTWAAAGGDLLILPYAGNAVTASTTSTVTYSIYLTFTSVLPAGTWEITTICWAVIINSTVNNGAQLDISAPVASTFAPAMNEPVVFGKMPLIVYSKGSVVSDGVAATTFTARYRANVGGTAQGDPGTMLALCKKV